MSERSCPRVRCEVIRSSPAWAVALVGVALVVGLILGLVVLAGTQVSGLGGGPDGGSASDGRIDVPAPAGEDAVGVGAADHAGPGAVRDRQAAPRLVVDAPSE